MKSVLSFIVPHATWLKGKGKDTVNYFFHKYHLF